LVLNDDILYNLQIYIDTTQILLKNMTIVAICKTSCIEQISCTSHKEELIHLFERRVYQLCEQA